VGQVHLIQLLLAGAVALAQAADPTRVDLEIESGTMKTSVLVVDPTASGGHAVRFSAGGGRVDLDLPVLPAGPWYVWIRTRASTAEDNGLLMLLDGKPVSAPPDHKWAGVPDIYLTKKGWSWEPEWQGPGKGNHEGPIILNLSAGKHRLTLLKRKTELPLLDRLILTRDAKVPGEKGALPPGK